MLARFAPSFLALMAAVWCVHGLQVNQYQVGAAYESRFVDSQCAGSPEVVFGRGNVQCVAGPQPGQSMVTGCVHGQAVEVVFANGNCSGFTEDVRPLGSGCNAGKQFSCSPPALASGSSTAVTLYAQSVCNPRRATYVTAGSGQCVTDTGAALQFACNASAARVLRCEQGCTACTEVLTVPEKMWGQCVQVDSNTAVHVHGCVGTAQEPQLLQGPHVATTYIRNTECVFNTDDIMQITLLSSNTFQQCQDNRTTRCDANLTIPMPQEASYDNNQCVGMPTETRDFSSSCTSVFGAPEMRQKQDDCEVHTLKGPVVASLTRMGTSSCKGIDAFNYDQAVVYNAGKCFQTSAGRFQMWTCSGGVPTQQQFLDANCTQPFQVPNFYDCLSTWNGNAQLYVCGTDWPLMTRDVIAGDVHPTPPLTITYNVSNCDGSSSEVVQFSTEYGNRGQMCTSQGDNSTQVCLSKDVIRRTQYAQFDGVDRCWDATQSSLMATGQQMCQRQGNFSTIAMECSKQFPGKWAIQFVKYSPPGVKLQCKDINVNNYDEMRASRSGACLAAGSQRSQRIVCGADGIPRVYVYKNTACIGPGEVESASCFSMPIQGRPTYNQQFVCGYDWPDFKAIVPVPPKPEHLTPAYIPMHADMQDCSSPIAAFYEFNQCIPAATGSTQIGCDGEGVVHELVWTNAQCSGAPSFQTTLSHKCTPGGALSQGLCSEPTVEGSEVLDVQVHLSGCGSSAPALPGRFAVEVCIAGAARLHCYSNGSVGLTVCQEQSNCTLGCVEKLIQPGVCTESTQGTPKQGWTVSGCMPNPGPNHPTPSPVPHNGGVEPWTPANPIPGLRPDEAWGIIGGVGAVAVVALGVWRFRVWKRRKTALLELGGMSRYQKYEKLGGA